MKKQSFQVVGLTVVAALSLAACSGLGKLVKNADQITYKVSPEVLAVQGDSIMFSINGNYPAKTFPKKAIITTTPVLVYEGGEQAFKPVTLIGEQVEGKGTTIKNAEGGKFSYTSNKIAYVPGMKVATLELRTHAEVKSKTKDIPAAKVADATITTPLLVMSDDKVMIGKDNFQKVVTKSKTSSIFFVIDESRVYSSKVSSTIAGMYNYNPTSVGISATNALEIDSLKSFLKDAIAKGSIIKGISISAYASPDGELTVNTKLAEERADNTIKELIKIFKSKDSKLDTATTQDFYKKVTTAEDWEGFKAAMEGSSIPDKDLILRVLTMYPDGETREKEIRNLSATFLEIKDNILPKLRRSVVSIEIEEKSLEDDQISKLATSTPEKLTVEELLYAATLTEDVNTKLQIYDNAARLFPQDWRAINNAGYANLLLNQVNEAEAAFKKADELSPNNSIVKNNLGVIERKKGNRTGAMELLSSATEAGFEPSYNMGIIEIQNGNYPSAVTNFGDNSSFNAALAKLLNGMPDDALSALESSNEKDAALSYYLRAVIAARKNSVSDVVTNLKVAVEKDASFKEMASKDAEFLKFKEDADFKAVVN